MKRIALAAMLLAAFGLTLAACSGEADVLEPEVIEVEKIITVEVPVEREVVREVPVEREVVREVEVERIVEVEKIVTVEVETQVEVVTEKIVTVEVEKVVQVEKVIVATPTPPPAGTPRFGGTLRVVSQASIPTLDSGSTGAYVTVAVASHMFEGPFGWDANLTEQPRMVDTWDVSADGKTWTMSLRDGLTFHNGRKVTAEDMVTSLGRWLNGWDASAGLMLEFVADPPFSVVDDETFTLNLTEPFGAVLVGLAKPWGGVNVMPAGIANVPSSTIVSEWVGSGPYKFSRWEQGHQVVLDRFGSYVPRTEASSLYSGEVINYLDRIIWLEIPDEETKIAGLQTGEWDVVDGAGLDFFDRVNKDPNLVVPLYKPGHRELLCLIPGHAPFDDPNARRAVQVGVDTVKLMSSLGPDSLWELCPGAFYCGTPWETTAGTEGFFNVNDKELARQFLADSDYAGETITFLNPTDYATLTPVGIVAKQELEAIGFSVEMPGLDWSTVVSRLGTPEEIDAFTDWGAHWCCGEPISDSVISGAAAFWPKVPKILRLRREFAQATTYLEKFAILEDIQTEAFINVNSTYLGVFFTIFPHTSDLRNFEVKAFPFYANTWLTR